MNNQSQRTRPTDKKVISNILDVENIFRGSKKIKLRHQGDQYTLQITSNNKLLLTK